MCCNTFGKKLELVVSYLLRGIFINNLISSNNFKKIFHGFNVGGNQTCNLMQILLYLIFKTYGVGSHWYFFFPNIYFLILKNSIKPYITGHYDRLSDVKKRAFLETIKSQDHLMKIIDLILSQLSYYKETQKKDAYHSLPVILQQKKLFAVISS